MTLSYAVIGTGAIGGYYGGRLAESGCDVHFLLRSDYEHTQHHGLVVDSVDGDFVLPKVNAYAHPTEMPSVDVVIVALKTTQNHQLMELLPPLKPESAILLLQNGLEVEAAVEKLLTEKLNKDNLATAPTICGGLCFICANKVGPGHIQHSDYGRVLLGAHSSVLKPLMPSPLLKAITVDFNRAKVETDITNDLPMARWQKLVWNVPYNGLSVVLDATTTELMASSDVKALIATLMHEVVAVANAWGEKIMEEAKLADAEDNSSERDGLERYDVDIDGLDGYERALSTDLVEMMLEHTETMASYLTSMKLDFDRQRPLEIESILGVPLQVAETLGVLVPAMTMLYQQLVFLNARNVG
ncbi:MAG: 2-dehydropantoate 2-reductase [Phormidesmis sp.]